MKRDRDLVASRCPPLPLGNEERVLSPSPFGRGTGRGFDTRRQKPFPLIPSPAGRGNTNYALPLTVGVPPGFALIKAPLTVRAWSGRECRPFRAFEYACALPAEGLAGTSQST